jgi:hypothetical protein
MRVAKNILIRIPEGKRPLGRPSHRWRIILEFVFVKQMGRCGLDASDSG